ncbi:MAG: amylo-alpha-1,6-glucosidase [Acidimicrobiia bacterium]
MTNGLGSFASGTVSGLRTRRYHGLLVAALRPPVGRTVLVAGVADTAFVAGTAHPLFSARWQGPEHPIVPDATDHLERFRLIGSIPEWEFAAGQTLISRTVWMEPGEDVTYLRYRNLADYEAARIHVEVFVEYRDFHHTTTADGWEMQVEPIPDGVQVVAFEGATPIVITCPGGEVEPDHTWHLREYLQAEDERGLDSLTDRLRVATIDIELAAGQMATLRLATRAGSVEPGAITRRRRRDEALLVGWEGSPDWVRPLVLAADHFVVERVVAGEPGTSIIAGYPWFADWGRDTMISLPGLLLATGRHDEAGEVLRTFAAHLDAGMLPNRFPDSGDTPEYNTVDATLWLFDAVERHLRITGDATLARDLYPALVGVVDRHLEGTRHGIVVDPDDGLVWAGEPGVQLTWMDAKVGDRVVTPRIGKPVEVNALWHRALLIMADLGGRFAGDGARFEALAGHVALSFDRFWNPERGFCFDVLDGPGGHDPSLRPNQLLAASLPDSPLSLERRRSVVEVCERELLVPLGLRTLGPNEPAYRGAYRGGPAERDGAYHQGTAWPWLLGAFVSAHLGVFGDRSRALSYLEPLARHLGDAGLGSVSEVVDGNTPHRPGGTPFQAWSVAEALRAWQEATG